MSRIGMKPIPIPDGVDVDLSGQHLAVSGKNGKLEMVLVNEVSAQVEGGEITVNQRDESKRARTMWGMQRTLVSNLVTGVSEGFKKELEINGVGYRAAVDGRMLTLQLGYSHEVAYPIPEGINIVCERPTAISVSGINRQRVGQVAAEIRSKRPPEPYKGKGIKYADEHIQRKEGKKK
ncbi:MAG: 50S ribosomal protein L6 [Proteobacteria bacterium]|nr:50S ribosomal protein L6 [Pseudomonadota bacterium]